MERTGLAEGMRRGAEAMARLAGGCEVRLRLPAPPVAGVDGEELGVSSPWFVSTVLHPVAVRRDGAKVEVLVPAGVMEEALQVTGAAAVRTALEAVRGVQAGDALLELEGVRPVWAAGGVCLYGLRLRERETGFTG